MIYIVNKKFLLQQIFKYSKSLEYIKIFNNSEIDYKNLMEFIEKINQKNSYTRLIRILKKENSILEEDIILEIRKSYKNKKGKLVIYLKK